MAECVRVLGFTDLRIEHVLLTLCCYCNRQGGRMDVDAVKQLIGELMDISSGIGDFHVCVFERLLCVAAG